MAVEIPKSILIFLFLSVLLLGLMGVSILSNKNLIDAALSLITSSSKFG